MHTDSPVFDFSQHTTVAERFRIERERRGIRIETVAALCGVTVSEAKRWEVDGDLSAQQLQACAWLGMDVGFVLVNSAHPMRDRSRVRWMVITAVQNLGGSIEDAFLIADGVGAAEG